MKDEKTMKMKFLKVILLSAAVLLPSISLAGGIQVSPSSLEINLENEESKTVEITVANPTSDVQIFEVYPDAFEKQILVNPKSFTLEAGGRKVVEISAKSSADFTRNSIATTLSVVGKPLAESEIQANTGVKVPVSISSLSKPKDTGLANFWLPAVAIAALIFWVIYERRKQKNHASSP